MGVYEADDRSINVTVSRTGRPIILVLSAHESAQFVLSVAPGVEIREIILNGQNRHTVMNAPQGAVLSDLSGRNNLAACAYAWPGDDQGCATQGLVAALELRTGVTTTSFQGCYNGSRFQIANGNGSDAEPGTCEGPISVGLDSVCGNGGSVSSEHTALCAKNSELHIIGVYEPGTTTSTVQINVTRTASPLVLVLSSYDSAQFVLNVGPSVVIDEIILNGSERHSVTNVPVGTVVRNRSNGSGFSSCAYAWPGDNQGCDTQSLASGVEAFTGLTL